MTGAFPGQLGADAELPVRTLSWHGQSQLRRLWTLPVLILTSSVCNMQQCASAYVPTCTYIVAVIVKLVLNARCQSQTTLQVKVERTEMCTTGRWQCMMTTEKFFVKV